MRLSEAFKALDALNEDTFSLSDEGIKKLAEFENNDDLVDELSIIDLEAETEDDFEESYVGKVILDCCVCHSKLYKDKEDVEIDEESQLANVGEDCPYCYTPDGFKVIGEVAAFNKVAEESEVDDTTPVDDVDEKPTEEEVNDDKDSEKIEESLDTEKVEEDTENDDNLEEDKQDEPINESVNNVNVETDDDIINVYSPDDDTLKIDTDSKSIAIDTDAYSDVQLLKTAILSNSNASDLRLLKSDFSDAADVSDIKVCMLVSSSGNAYDYYSVSPFFSLENLEFVSDGTKVGATASFSNMLSDAKTVTMILVVKNSAGAIEQVYSSDTISVETDEDLSIEPVETAGGDVCVFFVDNWSSRTGIMSNIYTHSLN